MRGQIIKIRSNIHEVESNHQIYNLIPRGHFRKDKILPRVGDEVEFDEQKQVIEKILPRKNEFDRPLVSNIDQAFIVTSLKEPDLSLSLLDRFLIMMELHHVTSIICLSKKDLLTKKEQEDIKPFIAYYKSIGYLVVYNDELDTIKQQLKGKTSVFVGQSGAGKSTLLNHLDSSFHLETGEISKALGRGRHTTRNVELYPFLDGKVLDTPGFSALTFQNSKGNLKEAFVEFQNYPCPFKDCSHTNEKECVVKQAVVQNKILESRYQSYLKFLKEMKSC